MKRPDSILHLLLKCTMMFFVLITLFPLQGNAGTNSIVAKATRGTEVKKIIINWGDVPHAMGYHVLRSKYYDGPYTIIGWANKRDEAYTDTDVERAVYYWYKVTPQYILFPGIPSKRVQGWIQPSMAGGMVNMTERISGIIGQVPHAAYLKQLAFERLFSLPIPDIDSLHVPDNATIYSWVERVCEEDHRRVGSPESKRIVGYLKNELGSILGAEVFTEDVDLPAVYTAEDWKLEINTGEDIIDFPAFYTLNTGMTLDNPNGGTVTGEMIWAGAGSVEEFDNLGDISGKVVVAQCTFPEMPIGLMELLFSGGYYTSDPESWMGVLTTIPMTFARSNFPPEYYENERINESVYWQAYDRGAAGIVLAMTGHPGDTNTHWGPYDGKMRPMPGMWVSSYKEEEIKALAQNGATASITITGTVKPGNGVNLYSVLEGQNKDEIILISSHHDSCHKGAVEDGTGVAMVLAQAQIWANVPLEKRTKTIVFSLTDGHFYKGIGAEEFAHKHLEDIMKKTIININLEHLAAKGAYIDNDGKMKPANHGAPSMIFATESPTAISATARMLHRVNPERTMEFHSTLLGDVPPGEAGHFHIVSGIDFIHWIGAPMYVLTAEDTFDMVDQEMLSPLASGAAELVATYMMLPDGYSDYK